MPGLDPAEHARVNTLGIVGRLDQIGPKRADEHGFAEPLGTVLADVPGDFTGAHRVADERYVGEIQRAQQRIEIGCEGIVVVPDTWLAGSAEAAAIVGDHAMAGGQTERRSAFPRRRRSTASHG